MPNVISTNWTNKRLKVKDDALARLRALRKQLQQPARPNRPAVVLPPPLTDRELFRREMTGVKPLPSHDKVRQPQPKPLPEPFQHLRDEQQALIDTMSDWNPWEYGPDTGNEIVFLRDGVRRDALKKLRSGLWVIQGELDLHGCNVDQARLAVAQFLLDCRKHHLRCIRIIHGKGLGSKNRESVLRGKVPGWLMQRDEVLAFCQAPNVDGGSGALFVLLRGGKPPVNAR